MDLVKFKHFINKNKWVFAKSYARTAPHEYTVMTDDNSVEFAQAVEFIRKMGSPGKFWKKEYIYFSFEGFSYWTMGAPVVETIIINRVKDE